MFMLDILSQLWSSIWQSFSYNTLHDFIIVLGLLVVDFILVFSNRGRFNSRAERRNMNLLGGLIPIITVISFQAYLIAINGGVFSLPQTDLQLVILYYFLIMLDSRAQILYGIILSLGLFIYFSTQTTLNHFQLGLGMVGIVLIALSTYYVNMNSKKILGNMLVYLFWLIIWGSSWWMVLILGLRGQTIYNYVALIVKFILLMSVVHYLNYFVRTSLDRYLKIENASKKDYLTGVLNRESFNQASERAFQMFQLNHKTFSLIMFDIDKFKSFNDTYGHTIGDQVLQLVTRQTQYVLSKSDLDGQAFRLGGEEFGILVYSSKVDKAKELAKQVAIRVKSNPLVNEGVALKLTISMGVTEINKTDKEFNDVYQRADNALYHSKNNGRSSITIDQEIIKI